MQKQNLTILVLVVLLAVALVYIGYGYYSSAQQAAQTAKQTEQAAQTAKQTEQAALYNQGAQYGAQLAIYQIFQQAATCQQVPLFYGNSTVNQTINVVAIECLQQAAARQAAANHS
jgi:Tfp pilus assembly protein PilO